MGRLTGKVASNPWYRARIEASEWDDRLVSREGAAEVLGMSESSVSDTELGKLKCMPPEKAELMACAYKAPELIGYYCMNECPLGKYHSVASTSSDICQVAVQFSAENAFLDDIERQLISIAYDGVIDEDEKKVLSEISDKLGRLGKIISQVRYLKDKVCAS